MTRPTSLMSDEAARVGPGGDLVAAVAATYTAASPTNMNISASYQHFAERSDVGNIGVFLCNWGKTTKKKEVQAVLDAMIKRNPCQIIIMNEVDDTTKNMMTAPPKSSTEIPNSVGQDAAVAEFFKRPEYAWRVAKTDAPRATLIGVKVENSVENGMTVLYNNVRQDGTYQKHGKTKSAETHLLIVEPIMKKNTGHLGKKPVTMGVHFHYATAGNQHGLRKSHKSFWNDLAKLIKHFDVKILGGDWNKSLFKVVPELRSRGILIETVAWYPWCSVVEGKYPCADSMALHIVNTIVEKTLCVDISGIGDSDSYDGWSGPDSSQALRNLRSWPMGTGPGMLVKSYLPTNDTVSEKMEKLLRQKKPQRKQQSI